MKKNLTFRAFLRLAVVFCVFALLPFVASAQQRNDTMPPHVIDVDDPTKNPNWKSNCGGIPKPTLESNALHYIENRVISIVIAYENNTLLDVFTFGDRKEFTQNIHNRNAHFEKDIFNYKNPINQDAITELVSNSCDDVHIFKPDIDLLTRCFISPFGNNVANNYIYTYKKDTIYEGKHCKIIDFKSKHKDVNTFSGWFFLADTSYTQLLRNPKKALEKEDFMIPNTQKQQFYIKNANTIFTGRVVNAELHLPSSANINYIDSLTIHENYELIHNKALDTTWSPRAQEITVYINPKIPFVSDLFDFYVQTYNKLDSTQFNNSIEKKILQPLFDKGDIRILKYALKAKLQQRKDFSIKSNHRLSEAEIQRLQKIDKENKEKEKQTADSLYAISKKPAFKHLKNTVYIISTGTIPIKWIDIGSIYDIYQWNIIQGDRVRLSIGNSATWLKNWNIQANIAYGFGNNQWRFGGIVEHKIPIETGVLRIGAKYQDEVFTDLVTNNTNIFDRITGNTQQITAKNGTTNIMKNFFNFQNIVVANIDAYRANMFAKLELNRNAVLEVSSVYSHIRNADDFYKKTIAADKTNYIFNDVFFNTIETGVTFRYASSEAYLKGDFLKFRVKRGYEPVFSGSLQAGSNSANVTPYYRTSLGYNQNFKVSRNQWLELGAKAVTVDGDNLNPLLLLSPNAQETLISDATNINTVSMYELRYNRYAQIFAVWHGGGDFLNKIPGINTLKLREVMQIKTLWGNLDSKYELSNENMRHYSYTPYFEGSVGLENILQVLRFDCYFRINPIQGDLVDCYLHTNTPKTALFDRFIFKITTNFNF